MRVRGVWAWDDSPCRWCSVMACNRVGVYPCLGMRSLMGFIGCAMFIDAYKLWRCEG